MKKLLTLFIAFVCCFTFTACEDSSKNDSNSNATAKISNATELLTTIWDTYKDEDKFAAMGGDPNHMVENAPGSFDVKDVESLSSFLVLPEDLTNQIDDAASLIHSMNANTFTSGAFHISDSKNTNTFISTYKDAILNNQWMCGFPEKLLIFQIDENYVVSAFGNGDLIKLYQEKLTKQFPSAKLVVEENF